LVPCNWELQGFGIPIYSNIAYPFKSDPPEVMSDPPKNFTSYLYRNPVGSYITSFSVPDTWNKKLVFINFGGVQSAMYVWVNGQKVGYSENSMSPAEFDITKYIHKGENKLAVEVYRWCDGSYLEDQDIWRLSGIFRDVDLIARPRTFIRDFFVKALPDNAFDKADISLALNIENRSEQTSSGMLLVANVTGYSRMGEIVDISLIEKVLEIKKLSQASLEMKSILKQPKLWSAEAPDLYHLTLKLKNNKNEILDKQNVISVYVKLRLRRMSSLSMGNRLSLKE